MWRKNTRATHHDSRHADSEWVSDFYQGNSYEVEPLWWPLVLGISIAVGVTVGLILVGAAYLMGAM